MPAAVVLSRLAESEGRTVCLKNPKDLADLRRDSGRVSQVALAEKAGCHKSLIAALERGPKNITEALARRIIGALSADEESARVLFDVLFGPAVPSQRRRVAQPRAAEE